MKSTLNSRRTLIVIFLLLALVLVACERPLQEEEATATPEPTIDAPSEAQPDAGQESGGEAAGGEAAGEAAPTLVPTAAAPAGEGGESTEGAAEQPPPEGGEPATPAEGGAEETTQPPPAEEPPPPEPTAPAAVQLPSGEQVHTVQAGQNLYRIGLQYGCTVAELSAYNGIANPHYIYVGQEIRIPATCGG